MPVGKIHDLTLGGHGGILVVRDCRGIGGPTDLLREERRTANQGAAGDLPGSTTEIRVPCPGGLSMEKRPPRASTRSASPGRPEPSAAAAPPMPSSVIVACSSGAASRVCTSMRTEIDEA